MRRTVVRSLTAVAAVLLLTAGNCGGEDPIADDLGIVLPDTSTTTQQSEPNTGSGSTTAESDSNTDTTTIASGDFRTVFGIPPFGTASLQPGFGEYSEINDTFQCSQNVFFVMTGTDRDQVIAYYTDTLGAAGYQVGPPLQLGDSIAINLTMPGADNITGVIQVGPLSPTDPTLGVNHGRTELKESPDDGSQEVEPDSVVSSEESLGDATGDDS